MLGVAMAKLPYVKEYTDDCGIRRRYFRRKGYKGGPLPGPIGSSEFLEAYQALVAGKPAPLARARNGAGTFGGLIAAYYGWTEFTNLKPSSKSLYRYALEPLREKHGHRPLATMTRENLIAVIEKIGERAPGMANLTRAVLQKMLKCALERNEIRENPLAKKVTPYKTGTHHTWTDAELEQFEARWPLGTRQRLAYALLFYTGQRGGDVVRMSRKDISEGRIRIVQEKTGTGELIAMRVKHGSDTPVGHRISNLIEQCENLRTATGDQREHLIKNIERTMAEIKALTPEK
jgi:integrase